MTCPRNPSEIARLYDEVDYWKQQVKDLRRSKSAKAEALKELRKVEDILGLDGENYHSEKF